VLAKQVSAKRTQEKAGKPPKESRKNGVDKQYKSLLIYKSGLGE